MSFVAYHSVLHGARPPFDMSKVSWLKACYFGTCSSGTKDRSRSFRSINGKRLCIYNLYVNIVVWYWFVFVSQMLHAPGNNRKELTSSPEDFKDGCHKIMLETKIELRYDFATVDPDTIIYTMFKAHQTLFTQRHIVQLSADDIRSLHTSFYWCFKSE